MKKIVKIFIAIIPALVLTACCLSSAEAANNESFDINDGTDIDYPDKTGSGLTTISDYFVDTMYTDDCVK